MIMPKNLNKLYVHELGFWVKKKKGKNSIEEALFTLYATVAENTPRERGHFCRGVAGVCRVCKLYHGVTIGYVVEE